MPISYFSSTPPLLFTLLLISLPISSFGNDNLATADIDAQQFNTCLDNLANTASFNSVAETLAKYRPIQADASVLKSLNYQPEFTKEPWDYLASLVDKERVNDGISASADYADVLNRIEAEYGVSRYDVLGVWGVESDFGTKLGKKDVIDSLATLSCFGRRQSYFRGELVSALKILKQGDITKSDFKGSWAGAFGQTQFMPSTFLRLAQDFDGDNRKDLVNSQADALASTANFLINSGYKPNQPWGFEVQLPATISAVSDRKNKRAMSHWRHLGVTLPDGSPLPDTLASAGLFLPAGNQGPAFLVGRNFESFYAYNASENYALAIAHLSQLIAQHKTQVNFATAWPTDDPGLSRKQSRDVQEWLNLLGYDVGEVDGIIGDNTRHAIEKYQQDTGIEVDGRAGQKIHQRLMDSTLAIREAARQKQELEAVTDNAAEQSSTSSTESQAADNHATTATLDSTSSDLWSRRLQLAAMAGLLIAIAAIVVIVSKRRFKK